MRITTGPIEIFAFFPSRRSQVSLTVFVGCHLLRFGTHCPQRERTMWQGLCFTVDCGFVPKKRWM